jgi:hypothetical protein
MANIRHIVDFIIFNLERIQLKTRLTPFNKTRDYIALHYFQFQSRTKSYAYAI